MTSRLSLILGLVASLPSAMLPRRVRPMAPPKPPPPPRLPPPAPANCPRGNEATSR